MFFEVSAKRGEGINEMFQQIATALMGGDEANKEQSVAQPKEPETTGVVLSNKPEGKTGDPAATGMKKASCCGS